MLMQLHARSACRAKEEILSEISRLKGMSDEATQNMRSRREIMTQIKELNHQRDIAVGIMAH